MYVELKLAREGSLSGGRVPEVGFSLCLDTGSELTAQRPLHKQDTCRASASCCSLSLYKLTGRPWVVSTIVA